MKSRFRKLLHSATICLLAVPMLIAFGSSVQADPHAGQSQNVVIIGGTTLDIGVPCGGGFGPTDANAMWFTGGGCLPVTGPTGELGDFNFTAMDPSAVNAANLAPFDTAVLNVATVAMACNTNTLSSQAQSDLIAFVGAGKKLIIYDSECFPGPVDYSWLPFPFETSNPGALGAPGTLTVVEDNTLSTLVGDPSCLSGDIHCIDVARLGPFTDAVGDMNVMTTFDPNWFIDMSGTNAIGTTGPVHTYANFPTGTDDGLIIYNGLDVDYLYIDDIDLRKIWVQELQQPFNPSDLPGESSIVGITLEPGTDENFVGEDHTVTASTNDLLGNPVPDVLVTFTVLSGPNAGATGACTVNADCTTDVNGQVNFTYTGIGGVGTDEIKACFTDEDGNEVCSLVVTKNWVTPPNEDPDCSQAQPSLDTIWPPNHKFVAVNVLGVTDPDDDPISITIDSIVQDEPVDSFGDGRFAPDGMGVGTASADVRAERSGSKKVPGNGRFYHIGYTADDGQGGSCSDEVTVAVPHDQNAVPVDDGALYDSTVP